MISIVANAVPQALLKELLPSVFSKLGGVDFDKLVCTVLASEDDNRAKQWKWNLDDFCHFYVQCLNSDIVLSNYRENLLLCYQQDSGKLVIAYA